MLTGRHKDGVDKDRKILRVSYNDEQFRAIMTSLVEQVQEGERIYASAGRRDTKKAMRLFREKQLASEYDRDPLDFYKRLDAAWFSSLMSPQSQDKKVWMFDCDSEEDYMRTLYELADLGLKDLIKVQPYAYNTKTGYHVLVAPFNKTLLTPETRALLHQNPFMLWYY